MIRADRKSMDRAIDSARSLTPLDRRTVAELDVIATSNFIDAQSRVPVDTTALRNSGQFESGLNEAGDTWTARMSWGGPSMPKNVEYAIFALAQQGSGDWLSNTPAYEALMEETIEASLRDCR